jgi:hypothetical protein
MLQPGLPIILYLIAEWQLAEVDENKKRRKFAPYVRVSSAVISVLRWSPSQVVRKDSLILQQS